MQVNNNIVIPESGKLLKTPFSVSSEVKLGKYIMCGDTITEYNITIDDVIEVTQVVIDDVVYYVESTTYEDLVSELIRLKYSLNAELALYANSRLNPDSQEEKDFQEYRAYCKKLAKQILNE